MLHSTYTYYAENNNSCRDYQNSHIIYLTRCSYQQATPKKGKVTGAKIIVTRFVVERPVQYSC